MKTCTSTYLTSIKVVSSRQRGRIYPIIPVGYIIKANMTISEFMLDISTKNDSVRYFGSCDELGIALHASFDHLVADRFKVQ